MRPPSSWASIGTPCATACVGPKGVLGRSLDDPSVRADLWFALAAVRPAGATADALGGDRG